MNFQMLFDSLSGWNESFVVGGISDDEIFDDIGPSIELYMNDKKHLYLGG